MSLTKTTAREIARVVADDLLSRASISDPVTISLFRRLHVAGSIRNLALILAGLNPGDSHLVRMVCIGIARNTANAISEAGTRHGKYPPRIPEVSHAISIRRVISGFSGNWEHHATCVFMNDGTDYVFDWHPTLDINNPILYKTVDWRVDRNGVELRNFSGFR